MPRGDGKPPPYKAGRRQDTRKAGNLHRELVQRGLIAGERGGGGHGLAVDENDFAGFGDGIGIEFEAAIIHQVVYHGLGGGGGVRASR